MGATDAFPEDAVPVGAAKLTVRLPWTLPRVIVNVPGDGPISDASIVPLIQTSPGPPPGGESEPWSMIYTINQLTSPS